MFDADSSPFNEFQISRTRKKARRSCLYCQRAHKTCGNERPCGQCVSRGMPSECADGHRKPPKYLSDTSTKRARTRRRRGVSSEQQPCQSNQSHELAFAERERQTMSSQSIEEIFEAFIDSSLYNTAKPITEVGGRNFMSPAAKGNEWLNQSCQSGGDWQFAETSPSDSDNSEESTAYQCLGERVRVNPAEKQAFPEDNLHLGFTISSGWSGTFFPNGVDDKP